MRTVSGLSALFLILGSSASVAQDATLPSDASMKMEVHGSAVAGSSAIQKSVSSGLDEFPSDIPSNQISKFANSSPLDVTSAVRSAKGGQIYRTVSPKVVLVGEIYLVTFIRGRQLRRPHPFSALRGNGLICL